MTVGADEIALGHLTANSVQARAHHESRDTSCLPCGRRMVEVHDVVRESPVAVSTRPRLQCVHQRPTLFGLPPLLFRIPDPPNDVHDFRLPSFDALVSLRAVRQVRG
jgi:hypothetical protein